MLASAHKIRRKYGFMTATPDPARSVSFGE
jgi:hypothetical protein